MLVDIVDPGWAPVYSVHGQHDLLGLGFDTPRPRLRLHDAPVSALRDPLADHLLTAQNAALLIIDYQHSQIGAVPSMDPDLLAQTPC
jgi:hypothetical protein